MGKQKYLTEEERKAAKREAQKRYRERHPDKCKERHKRWAENNPEKVKAHKKRWHINNSKQYYQEHKEEKLEYQKQYYQEHKEEYSEYRKKHYQEHKEEYSESNNRWREEHKDEISEWQKQYQKKFRQTPMGRAVNLVFNYKRNDRNSNRGECTLTAKWVVENIFSKPCHYCGKEGWDVIGCDRIDNSKPHTPDNVVPCCYECNTKKGLKDYNAFIEKMLAENPC